MDVKIYNTLSRSKEIFKPIKKGQVGIYNCGPTVYDTPHIGNYRTFVMYDLLRRVFEYNDYDVKQVMNITDVDDKTIRRSREEKITRAELAEKYGKLFLEGLVSMNIKIPEQLLKATDNIEAMIQLIETLLKKEIAYKASDGIYIHIDKVKDYGRLANLNAADLNGNSSNEKPRHERIANDEYDKDDPRDFSIWKFKTSDDSDNSWPAPFGEGRPGWHIECSAMAMKALGPTIDIHTGGADLIFPHHVNEIAQSESATGQQFVHYWMHGAFININEEKMAKSKGNFFKLEDLAGESISPLAYRYWLLTAHYRSPVNFTYEAVRAAQNGLIRLMAAVGAYPAGGKAIPAYKERFQAYINDDLDMPQAVALAWELVKDSSISDADKKATLIDFDRVFGLKLDSVPALKEEAIPAEVTALAEAREDARKAKDWKKADALRVEIESRGFEVLDSAEGFKVRAK
jgi:cysteinyl-tRNA synthetase